MERPSSKMLKFLDFRTSEERINYNITVFLVCFSFLSVNVFSARRSPPILKHALFLKSYNPSAPTSVTLSSGTSIIFRE